MKNNTIPFERILQLNKGLDENFAKKPLSKAILHMRVTAAVALLSKRATSAVVIVLIDVGASISVVSQPEPRRSQHHPTQRPDGELERRTSSVVLLLNSVLAQMRAGRPHRSRPGDH